MRKLLQRSSFRLLLAFAGLILLGALVLRLPVCAAGSTPPGFLDTLFTSASAVCVTGLTVVDTGSSYSLAGQVVILALIQLGALGILTFSNWVFLAVGPRRLRPTPRLILEQTHGRLPGIDPRRLLGQVLLFTAFWEGMGTLLLYARFSADFPRERAFWLALFHSISAFCNAGFSLFPDSLVRYRGDPFVNFTVMALIVAGGLGFIVFTDIFRVLRSKGPRILTLHSRVVLRTTLVVIPAGMVLVLLFEWNNPRGSSSAGERLLSSLFLSITSRTTGFNTVDTGNLCNASLLLLILLMILGASPGSTGGGIKTTTGALLVAMFTSRLRSRPRVELLGRSIPQGLITKALVVTVSFVTLVVLSTLLLEIFELGGTPHSETQARFLGHLFEVTSAIGTVGLSTGVTGSLGAASRLVLIACMLVGRLGPLLIAESLIGTRKPLAYELPEERIVVG